MLSEQGQARLSLRQRAIIGIGWNVTAKLIRQGAGFIISIFLMRLLRPTDYGLIGMAAVFIGFANIFKRFGFGSAIVQRSHLSESHYSSTFYLNISIGCLLTVLFVFIAPYLSQFYGDPDLEKVLQILSLNFAIDGFAIVPRAVLSRNMRFDMMSKIGIATAITTGIVAVGFAYSGFGVWALVIKSLLGSLLTTILFITFASWKPKWLFSWRSIGHLWGFSANLTGFNVINYWARRADDLLIGKFMGSFSLGLYFRAYALMLLPINHVISVISNVMFSALSKIQKESERVRRAYLKAMQILAFIIFPVMIGLFVVARPFVLSLFGQKWVGIVPLIQILTWVGIVQTLNHPTGWIYTSQNKTNWMFWWGIFGSGILVAAIVIGVWFGSVKSVAIAYTIANILITYPCIAIPGKLINMSFWDVIKVVYPAFINALIMALIVYAISIILPENLIIQLKLIIQVFIGILIYFGIAYFLNLEAFEEVKDIILKQLSNNN